MRGGGVIVYWLKIVSIICLWLTTLVRLPRALRYREQWALWTAIAMIAVVLTLYTKDVSDDLDTIAPAYVVYLGTHLISVVLGAVVLHLVLVTTGRHRFGPVLYATAIAAILLLAIFYLFASNLRPTTALDLSLGYWLVLAGFGSITMIACMALCWYCGRKTDHWILKCGLLILSVGFALLAVPWLLTIGESITHDEAWASSIKNIDGVSAACIAVGAILPLANSVGDSYRTLRSYARLSHLWRDMTRTAPNVVFPRQSRIRGVQALPGQLALYRRIIEIRDAITILRNYTTPEVIQAAEQHVAHAAVSADHYNAAITACWLAVAQDRQKHGHPARAQTLAVASVGGEILAQEVDFLVQVANAYRGPLPTDFIHHLSVEPPGVSQ